MELYRITTSKWAGKLSGSGYPARWNSKGVFVIYTASSRALACLENLVHRSGEGLNRNFKITVISVPENASSKHITDDELPDSWFKRSRYSVCRNLGDDWINSGASLLLEVPSSIIKDETNILINPNHPEFRTVEVTDISDFEFDKRL